ncbi:hypothetical protein COO60DRAFT_1513178 [Scenedesmus sp. NREL 46B-D3]|nr:hypothetical protein COO60DRAFT_1513178 [Scenedesmus sp. NREL 46B-D3]
MSLASLLRLRYCLLLHMTHHMCSDQWPGRAQLSSVLHPTEQHVHATCDATCCSNPKRGGTALLQLPSPRSAVPSHNCLVRRRHCGTTPSPAVYVRAVQCAYQHRPQPQRHAWVMSVSFAAAATPLHPPAVVTLHAYLPNLVVSAGHVLQPLP